MVWYRLLLALYPRAFRAEYGDELLRAFEERRREATTPVARVAAWCSTAADTVAAATGAHVDLARQDVRTSLRSFSRAPGFAAAVVLVAALGIGATATAFVITDHVLVRPLPFPRSNRLVKIYQDQSFRGYSRMELSPPNFLDYQRDSRSFDGMAAYTLLSSNLLGTGEPARVDGANVTGGMFAVLGVPPAMGRTLTSADDRLDAPMTVVISHALWQRQFGGRADILGQSILLDDEPHVVVGVMPASFAFPRRETAFWAPFRFSGQSAEDRTNWYLNVVARLRDEASLQQARTEMSALATRLAEAYPDANARNGATVIELRDEVTRQARVTLWALAGASLCMLLIACTNLASLLLSRTLDRHRELSVRTALGAGRDRLVRQMLTENVLLTTVGGFVGVGAAWLLVPFVTRLVPTTLPITENPTLDGRVLALCVLVTMATGLLFGVLPSMKLAASASLEGLKEGVRTGPSRSTERLRSLLVVAEVGASMVLVVCTGLLLQALWRVQGVHPGFDAQGVLTLRTSLPMPKYAATEGRERFYQSVLQEIRRLPGVTNASYISFLPMVMRGGIWPIRVDGQPEDPNNAYTASLRLVTPGFFDTLRVPLIRGRDVRDSDRADTPRIALISEAFAKRHWEGLDPIGRKVSLPFFDFEVVGIVGDIKVRGLERESEPQVYLASKQIPDGGLIFYTPKDLVVRAAGNPQSLVPQIRQAIARADPQVPVSDIRPLSAIVESDSAARVVQVRVLGAFAVTAVLLAAVGLHGLLSFSVAARTREIGVRLALGASRRNIHGRVGGRGMVLSVTGVVAGLVAAAWAASALQALLFGVDPGNRMVYGVAAGVCLVLAAVGTLLPALRAMKVDPLVALRAE
jgi:putative ABC transport system permease protein